MKTIEIMTITLDYSKILQGETSEETINTLMEIVAKGKDYLVRWDQTHTNNYLNELHDIALT